MFALAGLYIQVLWRRSRGLRFRLNQRYYIGFPGYLTVLLASDFYYIFLCCGIALKIKFSCKFPAEFCNLRWIR